MEWATDAAFTTDFGTQNVPANTILSYVLNLATNTWYFRVRAFNQVGASGWVTSNPISPALAALNGAAQPLVLANNFNGGLTGWTGQAGNVQTLAAAAMGNATGQGLAANLAPAALTVATDALPAYVSDQTPNELGSYMTNFFFDPNGATTGDDLIEIFSGLNNGAESIFGIQFQHTLENPDSYQIRAWAKAATEEDFTDWVSIGNGPQNIQFKWISAKVGSAYLYVDGVQVAMVTADTSGFKLDEVRLGPSLIGDVSQRFWYDVL